MDYFPSKLIVGSRFCNREKERKLLASYVERCRHVVIASPRRYGKSSLVNQVMHDTKSLFVSIDLFLANSDDAVSKRILDGIGKALSLLISPSQSAIGKVQKLFSKFQISINVLGFSLEPTISSQLDVVEQIFDALNALDQLAAESQKRLVIFIDEFQDIRHSKSSKAIQGALRHVAQKTQNLCFIFSGSSQHLLLELFDDKSKPFYMLCDKIFLQRISSEKYIPWIQKAAKARWGVKLDSETINTILSLTENHAFYVNLLCSKVWDLNDAIPTQENVKEAWQTCYAEERRRLVSEVSALTVNQQEVLKYLARNTVAEITSSNVLTRLALSASSIRLAVDKLEERDFIFLDTQGMFQLVDPLQKHLLSI